MNFQTMKSLAFLVFFNAALVIPIDAQEKYIPISGTDTIHGEFGYLCDDGGYTGNYQDNASGSVVIFSPSSKTRTVIQFIQFSLSTGDTLIIYDGPSSNSLLLGKFINHPGILKSTDSTGALTIQFVTDGSGNDKGFSAALYYEVTGPGPDLVVNNLTMPKDTIT